jgi:hypothetical protein
MSPFIFIPLAFFGTCATLTIIFIFCARELREWGTPSVGDEAESFLADLEAESYLAEEVRT